MAPQYNGPCFSLYCRKYASLARDSKPVRHDYKSVFNDDTFYLLGILIATVETDKQVDRRGGYSDAGSQE